MSDDSLAQTLQAKHDQNEERPSNSQPKAKSNGQIDLTSNDAFPTLGGNRTASPSLGAWGGGGAVASTNGKPQSPANAMKLSTTSEVLTMRLTAQQKANDTLPRLLAKCQKQNNVIVESSTSKAAGTTTFIIRGSQSNVQKAKRDIRKELAIKTKKIIQVPASARSSIIGSKGAHLKPIIDKSGCQIQVSRNDVTPTDDDEEELVDITIEGDNEGIEIAEEEIMTIVRSKVRDMTSKISIEEKFKPFVRQQFKPTDEIKMTIPQAGAIVLSGERGQVLETKAAIDRFAQNAAHTFATAVVPVSKSKQWVLDVNDVFDKTGVAAFLADDGVTLYGDPIKLKEARDYITTKTQNVAVLTLDISKAHDKSLAHAENVALYLQNASKIQDIESENAVRVKFPEFNGKDVPLEIAGSDAEKIKLAKKQVVTFVNSLPPSHVKRVAEIDDFFRPQVAKLAKHIQNEYYTRLVMSSPIVLVYEGDPKQDEDDFAPGAAEIEQTLAKANSELDEVRAKQAEITEQSVSIPAEDHKHITGPNNTTLNALVGQAMVAIKFAKDSVHIRGVKSEVDRVVKELDQVIHEGKNYEELSKYATEFKFPPEHVNKLIGKQGQNLAKIRDEFGVKIDVDEQGNGTVKGLKKNADEARARIIAQGKRMADETLERLQISNEKHAILIGQGGKFVRRLEDKYDVRVRFPRANGIENDRDAPRHKDEVVLRGPSRSVVKVKEELLDLLKYEEEHSYTEVLKVPSKAVSRIIGRQGEYINEIRDNTDTRIDFGTEGDTTTEISLVGTKTGVKEAVAAIQQVVKEYEDIVTESLHIDPKYHKLIIGPGGSTMREIIAKACGDDSAYHQRMIQVPRAGSNDSVVTVNGNKKYVTKVVKRINDIVSEQASKVEATVDVPAERHGALIGPGGLAKKEFEDQHKVVMYFPQQKSGKTGIKLVGKQEDVDRARAKIEQQFASVSSSSSAGGGPKLEVPVPKRLHNVVSDRGVLIKRLRDEYDVRVDHGRANPPKPWVPTTPKEAIGEVLITDSEDEVAHKFKWTVVEDDKTKQQEQQQQQQQQQQSTSTIPWRLRGSDEHCEQAKQVIEDAIKKAQLHNATGYLWLADATRYRMVVGAAGSQVNKIRDESGCTVYVPKAGANAAEEAIVLRGSKTQLDQAKEMILQSVDIK